ncbi:MAG: HAD family hydrolase [Myxococcota bacterium]
MPLRIDPERFGAVVADLDGVVTDTASLHYRAWKATFDPLLERLRPDESCPFDRDDYLGHVDGKPRLDGIRDLLAARHVVVPEGKETDGPDAETVHGIGARKNQLFRRLLSERGVEPFEDAARALPSWRRCGLATAVVSSSKNCRHIVESAGIAAWFDTRVDGAVAAELGLAGKPAPDLFEEAARRLGVPPARCVVLEDAESGVRAGVRGGFGLVVGVDREADGERLRRAGAHATVSSLDELTCGE